MNVFTIKKRRRRGMTLIEVGIASTISSLLAALGIGLIHSMISVNSAMKTQVDRQRTVVRLAETLRADAHRADTAKLEDKDSKVKRLVLKQTAGHSVEYTLATGEILRQVKSGEKQVAVDSFLLSPETMFDVSMESAGEKTLIILELNRTPEQKGNKRLAPLVAAVGTSPAMVEVLLPSEAEAVDVVEEDAAEAEAKSAEAPEEKAKPELKEEASE